MVTATVRNQTVVAVYDETRKQVRLHFEPLGKRIWLTETDFDLNPEVIAALKAAGADFDKVKMIGWEF